MTNPKSLPTHCPPTYLRTNDKNSICVRCGAKIGTKMKCPGCAPVTSSVTMPTVINHSESQPTDVSKGWVSLEKVRTNNNWGQMWFNLNDLLEVPKVKEIIAKVRTEGVEEGENLMLKQLSNLYEKAIGAQSIYQAALDKTISPIKTLNELRRLSGEAHKNLNQFKNRYIKN